MIVGNIPCHLSLVNVKILNEQTLVALIRLKYDNHIIYYRRLSLFKINYLGWDIHRFPLPSALLFGDFHTEFDISFSGCIRSSEQQINLGTYIIVGGGVHHRSGVPRRLMYRERIQSPWYILHFYDLILMIIEWFYGFDFFLSKWHKQIPIYVLLFVLFCFFFFPTAWFFPLHSFIYI